MANPFFDSLKFPWWYKPQADDLHRALCDAVPDQKEIRKLYGGCGENLPLLNIETNPDKVWNEALELLTSRQCLKTLCTNLLANLEFQNVPKVRSALQAVIDAKTVYTVRVLAEELPVPVLDRIRLRERIKMLDDDAHPVKVLLMNGERACGKSHSRHLFEYAARCRGAEAVYICEGIAGTVEGAVAELVQALDPHYKLETDFDTTDQATYQAICRELLRLAKRRERSLWIAVDDLGPSEPGGPPILQKRSVSSSTNSP